MRSAHMLTWPSAESKGLQDSEEERGEPQRFKFLCQDIGDTRGPPHRSSLVNQI